MAEAYRKPERQVEDGPAGDVLLKYVVHANIEIGRKYTWYVKGKKLGNAIALKHLLSSQFHYLNQQNSRKKAEMGQILGYLYDENKDYRITEIALVENEDKCSYAVNKLLRECSSSFPVLGMDCEWVPDRKSGEKSPVALLQLATVSGFCALFRLSHMAVIPESLKELLRNGDILKVGVGIQYDVHRLHIAVHGWVDIRNLEFLLRLYPSKDSEDKADENSLKLSLSSLSKRVLGIELDKDAEVRVGKWDADQLSEDQINYASWDALAAALICHELTRQEEAMQAYSVSSPVEFLRKYKEYRYKYGERGKTVEKPGQYTGRRANVPKRNYHTSIPSRKTPMYDNIFLLAPDGEILCTCDRKRAMWYVDKGIGTLIEENTFEESEDGSERVCKTTLKVKLNFEPQRRAIDESEKYYCVVKDNLCVVCGKEDSYLRKHIVPHEYRKYFPVWMKSHQSHDVLLLCIDCHMESNYLDLKVRRELAQECEAPLKANKLSEVPDAQAVKKVQSAAKALSRNPEVIPEKRRKELETIVLNYFASKKENESAESSDIYCAETVTSEMLQEAVELVIRTTDENQVPHGLKVVQHYQEKIGEEDGIRELEVKWRQHFMKEMRPKHLPPLWSTHHFRLSPKEKSKDKMEKQEEINSSTL